MNQMRESNLSHEVDEIRGDLNKLRDDLRHVADAMLHRGREQAEYAQDQLRSSWEQSMSTVQKQVEDRPVSTMACAFVVGMIIGRMLGK